jgi:hypothetical protein
VERTTRELFGNGDYDKAVPALEKGVEENPDNVVLLNLLAMAYLYSSSRVDSMANYAKVQPTMEKVIERGGEVTFLVGKTEDKLKVKFVVKAVMGELHMGRESLSFVPSRGNSETVGPLSKSDLRECGLNKGYGKDSNTFHIKTSKGELDFRPLHFSKDEANLVCSVAAKYLGVRTVN